MFRSKSDAFKIDKRRFLIGLTVCTSWSVKDKAVFIYDLYGFESLDKILLILCETTSIYLVEYALSPPTALPEIQTSRRMKVHSKMIPEIATRWGKQLMKGREKLNQAEFVEALTS